MNGAGNDFLIFCDLERKLPDEMLPRLAKTLCHRRLSIGADGIMVVRPAEAGGDYRMLFFNADGSLGEMCGNGARCICRYGYEMGLAGETQRVETTAGLVTGTRIDARNYRIRLNDPSVIKLEYPLEVGGKVYAGAYVELGNPGLPHGVVPMKDLSSIPEHELREVGRALRWHEGYPKGANVNFCEVIAPDCIRIKTFERGVEDFTLACGTGSGSTAAVLTLLGQVTGEEVRVISDGGELRVTVELEGNTVKNLWLTGPTNIVCEGDVLDEDLS